MNERLMCSVAPVEAILRFAQRYPVFPCRRNPEEVMVRGQLKLMKPKSPYTTHGLCDASQDPNQIRAWWHKWPDALVGVPTGAVTQLVVVDYDSGKVDDAGKDWIEENTSLLLATRSHTTLSGGRHYLFRLPANSEYKNGVCVTLAGKRRGGIDVRAEGGYIIWWPLHGSAQNGEVLPLPAGLVDEQRLEHVELPPLPKNSPQQWAIDRAMLIDALPYIDPADYDKWSRAGLAIHLASAGSDDGFALWHAWSAGELTGDIPHSYSGLNDCRYHWSTYTHKKERKKLVTVGTLILWAKEKGYVPKKREVEQVPLNAYADDERFEQYERSHAAREPKETRQEKRKREVEKAAEPLVLTLPKAPSLNDIVKSDPEYREWFFEEILPAGAFLIVGRPKVGKSWLLLQLAIAAATCRDFLGFAPLSTSGVLYITPEDDRTRVKSRFSRFEIEPPDNLHLFVRDDFANLAAQFSDKLTLVQFVDLYLTQNPEIKFVFMDTESTCRHVWEGENSGSKEKAITRKDYAEVREFDSIALKHRAFIGLVNHTAKRKNGTWFDIHELINRTNTALAGASGSIVIADPPGHDPMNSDSKVRVLGIRGRDINDDHLIAIEQCKNGAFESRGKWAAYVITEVQEQIWDALIEISKESPGNWIPAKEVAQWIHKTPGAVQRAVSRMVSAGRLSHKGHRMETKKKLGIKVHKEGE
jgi:hypothetical protein